MYNISIFESAPYSQTLALQISPPKLNMRLGIFQLHLLYCSMPREIPQSGYQLSCSVLWIWSDSALPSGSRRVFRQQPEYLTLWPVRSNGRFRKSTKCLGFFCCWDLVLEWGSWIKYTQVFCNINSYPHLDITGARKLKSGLSDTIDPKHTSFKLL